MEKKSEEDKKGNGNPYFGHPEEIDLSVFKNEVGSELFRKLVQGDWENPTAKEVLEELAEKLDIAASRTIANHRHGISLLTHKHLARLITKHVHDLMRFSEAFLTNSIVLDSLTDDQRLEIFGKYCKACGSKDPGCHCWNDE